MFLAFAALPALGAEYELGVTALGQIYSLRPLGGGDASRIRNAELLRFNAYDLGGGGGGGAHFVSLWRLETDFGGFANAPGAASQNPPPELCSFACAYLGSAASASASLLYGYLDVPELMPWASLRVGRMVSFDPSDIYAFDGARVQLRYRILALELAAGTEVRGPSVLGYTNFELDGLQRPDGISPLVEVGLLVQGHGATGRGTWKRVWLDGFSRAKTDVLAFSGSLGLGPFRLFTDFAGDASVGRLTRVVAGLDWARGPIAAGLQVGQYWPTFAVDSIWNFFSTVPYEEAALTGAYLAGSWRADARLFARLWRNRTSAGGGIPARFSFWKDAFGVPQSDFTAGGRLGGAWVASDALEMDGGITAMDGYGGSRSWLDAGGAYRLSPAWTLDARLLVGRSQDEKHIAGDRHGVQVGGRQSAAWRLEGLGSISLGLEENYFSGGRPAAVEPGLELRALAWLDLGTTFGGTR